VKIRFTCPECEAPAQLTVPVPPSWQCPQCDHLIEVRSPVEAIPACSLCGNPELYKKKDFPHWLGMSILAVACVLFFALNGLYHQWLAWAVLIASAVFDGGLYLWVGDAVVCYRCGATYHGVAGAGPHRSFDLGVGERYRQERLRREELRRQRAT
jgi:hypothetical protein